MTAGKRRKGCQRYAYYQVCTIGNLIIGDETFPLKSYLMRPYPGQDLIADERIFNYRLLRARRIVENTFGAAPRRIYHRTVQQTSETVGAIVRATCVLHNCITRKALQSGDYDGNDDYCKLIKSNRRQGYKDS